MPRTKKEENIIKEVRVTSKRTTPVGKEYYSFECSLVGDVANMSVAERDEAIKSFWSKANNEVDLQIEDVFNAYKRNE